MSSFNGLDARYRWYRVTLVDEWGKPKDYAFRGVTSAELRRAGSRATEAESENFILEQCVLPAQDWSQGLAGVSRVLLKHIYRLSGLDGNESPFLEAVHWMDSEAGVLEAAAVCMIPGLTFEQLDSCDPANRAKYLAIGKFMFETLYQTSVYDAFKRQTAPSPGTASGGLPTPPAPGMPSPTPGTERQVESTFSWTRKGAGNH